MGAQQAPEPVHLGDGLYASVDCGMIRLTTGHHDPRLADDEVYLEPEVFAALVAFARRVWPEVDRG